jgi:glucokinase
VKYIIGLDIGGTKIAGAIANSKDGKILSSINTPTQAKKGGEFVIEKINELINELIKSIDAKKSEIKNIVLGIPGTVDKQKGLVITAPNIKGWHKIPLKEKVAKVFPNIEIILENDANCAAMGEVYFGTKNDYKNIVFITISTGIGGGIVIDRKLYSGKNNIAGEIGHMPLNLTTDKNYKCNCGRFGCFEAYASGINMAKRATRKIKEIGVLKNDYGNITLDLASSNKNQITSVVLNEALKQNDQFAKEIIAENSYLIGIGCVNIINILDPEVIIIGGGVSKIGDFLFDGIKKTIKENLYMVKEVKTQIIPATLGTDAGILGTIAIGLSE